MRKIQYAIILSLGIFLATTITAAAQTISAGGGVGYRSKSEKFNFQVNAYYKIPNLPLRIGGDVGYSKPEDNLTHIEGNANVHLMLLDKQLLSIYGLTGLNVLHSRAALVGISDTSTNTDTGLNVGGGAEIDLGFGRGFGEAKYILGREGEEQVVLGLGIRVNISN